MSLQFRDVVSDEDIAAVAAVAHDIWFEYWPDRIGLGQTEYMVRTMQSREAIERDIRQIGYRYWMLFDEQDTCVGYTCALAEDFTETPISAEATKHGIAIAQKALRRLFISKIYLYAQERGKHYASRVIEFYEDICRKEDLQAMYLTVNRENELGIRAYLGRGFETIEELDAPIGDGYVMYDYIMCKMVPSA